MGMPSLAEIAESGIGSPPVCVARNTMARTPYSQRDEIRTFAPRSACSNPNKKGWD
jgi:hypothetical protein